jgi:hypothetical protein
MPFRVATLAVISAFALLCLGSSIQKSPTWDEPSHIVAGLSYIGSGRIVVNRQHPPLLKELSALFLLCGGVRWPIDLDVDRLLNELDS